MIEWSFVTNGPNCGLYACAWLVEYGMTGRLPHELIPNGVRFAEAEMRHHLVCMYEKGIVSSFPKQRWALVDERGRVSADAHV